MFALPLGLIGMLRFFFVKETEKVDTVSEKVTFKDVLAVLKDNKYVYMIIAIQLVYALVTGTGVATYYYTYIVGGEMEEFGVSLWLAPGMNIQRNPLCGRNFEYYSEDPLLSGLCAAADTRGVQKHPGRGACIKHFALNNQEDNRSHNNAHCSERAIREIYLRGFEIAVKEAAPLSLMTSYNLLNGLHTANSYELLTSILRDEWGFDGLVMTDWGTTGGGDMNPAMDSKYGFSDPAGCIKAGNDLIMPGSQQDIDGILDALRQGSISLAELQLCAERILKTVLRCT